MLQQLSKDLSTSPTPFTTAGYIPGEKEVCGLPRNYGYISTFRLLTIPLQQYNSVMSRNKCGIKSPIRTELLSNGNIGCKVQIGYCEITAVAPG